MLRVWKQRTDEHWSTENTGSGQRKVTSAGDDRHLVCMAMNGCIVSSKDLITPNRRRLRLQWDYEHRAPVGQISNKFYGRILYGRIHVRRYSGERCLPDYRHHNDRTPGIMVWYSDFISWKSQLLRIQDNLNSNMYVRYVLELEVIPGTIFQQDI
ncbi:transposable element Tc1 transposase [Trichonephila clavipes]|nr:transposable element Tc1 transposase [Trichonephila clavipes]